MSGAIYHITTRAAWDAAQTAGRYVTPTLESEGFIHFSRADQVAGVLHAFYREQTGLVLLEVDTARLNAELRWEPPAHPGSAAPRPAPPDDERFPHLYGPLNLDAVVAVHELDNGEWL